jgi:predicted nucleic acid-binding Zn ribbon protein
MRRKKYCKYCGKEIDRKSNYRLYCSERCRRQWHYEEQEDLFYVPGVKQDKCIVCGKGLTVRQLKYCSKACYSLGRSGKRKAFVGLKEGSLKRIE